jgi:hemoglobin-like flavoprotein
MGTIKQWLGLEPQPEEERVMEEPRSPWQATEPDAETRIHTGRFAQGGEIKEHEMTDDRERAANVIGSARYQASGQTSFAEAAERLPERDPLTDSGVGGLPGLNVLAPVEGAGVGADDSEGERCATCGGKIPGDHDLLTEILSWLAPAGEEFVSQFYIRLFEAHPELRPLFPEDIKIQEEKLLSAVVSLLKLFKAGDDEMEKLDSALSRFGRSHTRFDPAATIEEYAAVWAALADTATEMLGEKLTDRHAKALRRAYEYAAGKMLAAQATAKLRGEGRRRRTV